MEAALRVREGRKATSRERRMCGAAGCLGEKIVSGRSSDRLLESSVFLDGPQQASFLSILSWNISGIKKNYYNMLEKNNFTNLLYKYDIISFE